MLSDRLLDAERYSFEKAPTGSVGQDDESPHDPNRRHVWREGVREPCCSRAHPAMKMPCTHSSSERPLAPPVRRTRATTLPSRSSPCSRQHTPRRRPPTSTSSQSLASSLTWAAASPRARCTAGRLSACAISNRPRSKRACSSSSGSSSSSSSGGHRRRCRRETG